jgi:anti-sigma B factor antagonist
VDSIAVVARIDLSETVTGGVKVLRVDGEVDLSTTPRFRAAIDRLASAARGPLVVDLSGCSYIDSTGLAALLHGAGLSGDFAIVAGGGAPREVLHVTRIDETVPVFETLDGAREAAHTGS